MNEQFDLHPDGIAIFDPAGLVGAKYIPGPVVGGTTYPTIVAAKHRNGEEYILNPREWGRVEAAMLPKP